MDLSIFLGEVIGFYLLIVGFAYLLKPDYLREAVREIVNSPMMLLFAAIFTLILGLLLIFSHNVWEFSWRVLITIIGYITLTKGLLNLFYPEWARFFAGKFLERQPLTIVGVSTILVGLYLIYSSML